MAANKKETEQGTQTRVVYMNIEFDVAVKLAAQAAAEDRPMSVEAARIIKQYFADKSSIEADVIRDVLAMIRHGKGDVKAVEKGKKGS